MPATGADGEKRVSFAEFRCKVNRVLNQPSYRKSARHAAQTMSKYGDAQAAAVRIERFAAQFGAALTQ